MTLQEFSLEFDILYNNVTSNSAPPLDEYEKSVFLTMAQLEIVKELYSGRNQLGLAVETNEEVRQYLKSLIKENSEIPTLENNEDFSTYYRYKISKDRSSYIAILREWIEVAQSQSDVVPATNLYSQIPVLPVTQDNILQLVNNPFKGITKKRALRTEIDGNVYIYFQPPNKGTAYTFRWTYLDMPTPIILTQLPNVVDATGNYLLKIEGVDVTTEGKECGLPTVLHRDILKRAVQLAKQTYVGQTQE